MTNYIEGVEYSTKQVLMAAGRKGSVTVNNPEMISMETTFKAEGFDRRLLLTL